MAITEPRELLRLEIGDSDPGDQLFSDDELDVFLARHDDDLLTAAADACDVLAMRFARKATLTLTSGGDTVKRDFSKLADGFTQRAALLRTRARAASGAPWSGGTSRARKDALTADGDRVQPAFQRGQFGLGS